MKYLFRIAISVLLFAYCSLGLASKEELAEAFDGFDQIEMDFSQEVYDQFTNLIEVSSGKCRVSKPSISWQTLKPFEQSVLLSEDTLKIFDPDLEQLIVKNTKGGAESIPLNLLRKKGSDFKDFIVRKLSSDLSSTQRYSLTPVSKQAIYLRIEIEIRDKVLRKIKLFGLSGEESRIELSNSAPLRGADLVLRLDVPEGTDIVDG